MNRASNDCKEPPGNLIEDFVESMSADGAIDAEWRAFIAARREAELDAIIVQENLRPDQARAFMATAFRDGTFATTGTAITKVLPPASRFAADGGHSERKQRVLGRFPPSLNDSSDSPQQATSNEPGV